MPTLEAGKPGSTGVRREVPILRETAAYLLYRATGESIAGAPGIG